MPSRRTVLRAGELTAALGGSLLTRPHLHDRTRQLDVDRQRLSCDWRALGGGDWHRRWRTSVADPISAVAEVADGVLVVGNGRYVSRFAGGRW